MILVAPARPLSAKHFPAGPAPATGWLQQIGCNRLAVTLDKGRNNQRTSRAAQASKCYKRSIHRSNGSLQAKYKRWPLHTQPASLPAAAVRCTPQNSLASFHHSTSWKKRGPTHRSQQSPGRGGGGMQEV